MLLTSLSRTPRFSPRAFMHALRISRKSSRGRSRMFMFTTITRYDLVGDFIDLGNRMRVESRKLQNRAYRIRSVEGILVIWWIGAYDARYTLLDAMWHGELAYTAALSLTHCLETRSCDGVLPQQQYFPSFWFSHIASFDIHGRSPITQAALWIRRFGECSFILVATILLLNWLLM